MERHRQFDVHGLESPYQEGEFSRWFERESQPATTRIELDGFTHVRHEALLAHATQIDPSSTFWFGLPPEIEQSIFNFELFQLKASRVGPTDVVESDLFTGIE
jgi:mycothiol S-conjugate amidase